MTIDQAINRDIFPEIELQIIKYGGDGSIEINSRAITGIQLTGDCVGGNRVRPGGCIPKTFTVTINPQLLSGITPTQFIEYIYNSYKIETQKEQLDLGLDEFYFFYTYTYHKGMSDEESVSYNDPMAYRLYNAYVKTKECVVLEIRDAFAENRFQTRPFWSDYVKSQYEAQYSTRNLRTLFEFCVTYNSPSTSVSGLFSIPTRDIVRYPDNGTTCGQILKWIAETCACVVLMDQNSKRTICCTKMIFTSSSYKKAINANLSCREYTIPGYEVMDSNLMNYIYDTNNPFIDSTNVEAIRSYIKGILTGTNWDNIFRPTVMSVRFDPRINPASGAWLYNFTCWDRDGSSFVLTDTPSNAYVYITNYVWSGGLFMELTAAPLYETS